MLRALRRARSPTMRTCWSLSTLGGRFGRDAGVAARPEPAGRRASACSSRCAKSGRRCASRRSTSIPARRCRRLAARAAGRSSSSSAAARKSATPAGVRTVFRTVRPRVAAAAGAPRGARRSRRARHRRRARHHRRGAARARAARQHAGAHRPLAARRRGARSSPPAPTPTALRRHFIAAGARRRRASSRPAEIQRKTAAVLGAARDARQHRRLRGVAAPRSSTTSSTFSTNAPWRHLIADVEARHGRDRRRRPRRRRDRGQAARRQDAATAGRASSRPRCSGCCCCSATCGRTALRFLSVFSSVAGRFGNSGQSDYATANELMNRLCCQLRDQWRGRVERERAVLGSVGRRRSSAPAW